MKQQAVRRGAVEEGTKERTWEKETPEWNCPFQMFPHITLLFHTVTIQSTLLQLHPAKYGRHGTVSRHGYVVTFNCIRRRHYTRRHLVKQGVVRGLVRVLWLVTTCNLVQICPCFSGYYCLQHQDGILWNVATFLPDYTAPKTIFIVNVVRTLWHGGVLLAFPQSRLH
jgi:hypothetical protein